MAAVIMTLFQGLFRKNPKHAVAQKDRKLKDTPVNIAGSKSVVSDALDDLETEEIVSAANSPPEAPSPLDDFTEMSEIEDILARVELEAGASAADVIQQRPRPQPAQTERRADYDELLDKLEAIESKMSKAGERPVVIAPVQPKVHREEYPRREFEHLLKKIEEMDSRIGKVTTLIELEGLVHGQGENRRGDIPEPLLTKIVDIESRLNKVDNACSSTVEDSDKFERHIKKIEETLSRHLTDRPPAPPPPAAVPLSPVFSPAQAPMAGAAMEIPQFVRPASRQEAKKEEIVLDPFTPGRKSAAAIGTKPGEFDLADLDLGLDSFVPGKKTATRPKSFGPLYIPSQKKARPDIFTAPSKDFQRPSMMAGLPILTKIDKDYMTMVLLMRWIEFLFERVTRKNFITVLDYYKGIGWITEDVEREIISYARGEMQDVTKCMDQEETIAEEMQEDASISQTYSYKKVDDWRLSADDHLKSLLFIMKIAGQEIDRDRLNSLEHMIEKFKESLENFHAI